MIKSNVKISKRNLDSIKIFKAIEDRHIYPNSTIIDDTITICYFSNSLNSIIIQNFKSKKIKQIKLQNPPSDLKSFLHHSVDSIFLLWKNGVEIINYSGEIIDSFYYNNPLHIDGKIVLIGGWEEFPPIFYDEINSDLYVRHSNMDYKSSSFKIPIEVKINIKNRTFKPCSIMYPSIYRKHDFGDAYDIFRTYNKKKSTIYYTFSASPYTFMYNIKTGKVTNKLNRSKFDSFNIKPFDKAFSKDLNMKFDHLTTNNIYDNITFDPYNKLYYKIVKPSVPLKVGKKYNNFMDKPTVLMVMDEDLNIIDEFNIHNVIWRFSFVTPNGFYIKKNEFNGLYDTYYKYRFTKH